jgi:lysine 2,3-aminomutase
VLDQEVGDPQLEEFSVSSARWSTRAEKTAIPGAGLVHRYPDRALLIVTDSCAMYCRYCTRKRMVGKRPSDVHREVRGGL